MKKIVLFLMLLPVSAIAETNAELALSNAINDVRTQCSGISNDLAPLKKLAGISTAVNAVGTVTGAGGVVSGVAKHNKDLEIAGGMGKKFAIEIKKDKLQALELSDANQAAIENLKKMAPNLDWNNFEKKLNELSNELDNQERQETIAEIEQEEAQIQQQINKNQAQSDKYGNIRTGLFATNSATSTASAIISSKTDINKTVQEKIKGCTESVSRLRNASMRYRVENNDVSNTVLLSKSQQIADKCGEYAYVDTDALRKLANGATISGAVGATTGIAATITSATGTHKKLSDIDLKGENLTAEITKQESMDLASNILGGITVATSLTGATLNAVQINKIKKIITVSDECEGVLK